MKISEKYVGSFETFVFDFVLCVCTFRQFGRTVWE